MKRLISALSTLLLACIGLVALPQVAQAAGPGSRIVGVVGASPDVYFLPYACSADNGVQPRYYQLGDLPPGITLNSTTGYLSGTFQEAGEFQFSDFVGCRWYYGETEYSDYSYSQQLVTTTFEVYQEAAATPAAPTLTVDNLNDSSCSLRIRGSFPVQPDPGTAQISVTKGAVVNMATLVGQEANTPFDFTYETRNNGFPYGDLFTDRIGEGFACNESLDVRLSYKYHGSQVSSTVVNDVITSFVSSKPVIYNLEKYFDSCLIRVSGSFPSSGDVGTRPQVQIYSTEFEKSVTIYPIIDEGTFYIELPLDDFESYNAYDFGPLAEPDGESQVPPGCGDEWEAYAFYTVNNQVIESWPTFGDSRLYCDAGSFASAGSCVPAIPGTYAPSPGMTGSIPCPKGTFQSNAGATSCVEAAKGYYVNQLAAISATACPAGQTTLGTGSVTALECYVLKNQPFTTFKAPTKLKFRASLTVPLMTDSNLALGIALQGRCLSSVTTMKVKVGKVTRTVPALKITAGVEAGTCVLTLSNEGDAVYKPYTKVHTIKVSKTGK